MSKFNNKTNHPLWWSMISESQPPKIEYPYNASSKFLLNMYPIKENFEIKKKIIKMRWGNILSFLWQNMDKITGILIVLIMVLNPIFR